jgi:glycine C-acetyltransferase
MMLSYDVDAHACIIDGVRLHQGREIHLCTRSLDCIEKNLQRATKLAEEQTEESLVISQGRRFGMQWRKQGKLEKKL